jgi:hypothetical protein
MVLSKDVLAFMDNETGRNVTRLTDPRALRALAHPTRLSLVGTPDVAQDADQAAAIDLLAGVLAGRYFEHLRRWLATRHDEPAAWQEAAPFGDSLVYVTAEELAELVAQEVALVDRYQERLARPELRPPGARAVTYLHLAFPGDISGAARENGP